MANVLLTSRCNLSCKYCFAREKIRDNRQHMPLENVFEVIEFLKRSDFQFFGLWRADLTSQFH